MNAITKRQREFLEVVTGFQKVKGFAPTIREIGEAMEIKSTNGVVAHVKSLLRKKYLAMDANKARTMQVTPEGIRAMRS